jgi:hypothetical protein
VSVSAVVMICCAVSDASGSELEAADALVDADADAGADALADAPALPELELELELPAEPQAASPVASAALSAVARATGIAWRMMFTYVVLPGLNSRLVQTT